MYLYDTGSQSRCSGQAPADEPAHKRKGIEPMNVYMYQAALVCEPCGKQAMDELTAQGLAPEDTGDEYSYDSDNFPKGPYPDGGGESDAPEHCDGCGLWLENPLTRDGEDYVIAMGWTGMYLYDTGPH